MNLQGTRILVIGGAGFIGSHVVDALLQRPVHSVIVYDNFCRGTVQNLEMALRDPRCSVFPGGGDIRDTEILDRALAGVDAVVHLAGLWLLHCQDYPRAAFNVNVEGTFNVLEACARHHIKRFIFSSSASVYGNAQAIPMGEDHPLATRNLYGATKIAGEALCRSFMAQRGLPFVGLRYMNVYGPRQPLDGAYTAVVPRMLSAIQQGQVPVVDGDGTQTFDFIHVRDVARANVLALEHEAVDQFFNVGTGIGTTIKDLAQRLLKLSNLPTDSPRFRPYPPEDVRGHLMARVGDVELAKREIGFTADISLHDGLSELVAHWKSRSAAPAKVEIHA